MTYEQINNEQDKLISEFVKNIDIHMLDMIREVDEINIEANVIIKFFLCTTVFEVFFLFFVGTLVN